MAILGTNPKQFEALLVCHNVYPTCGDSINDAPLLAMVDHPILVQKPDGTYDPDLHLTGMIRAPGIGPVGWNEAVLDLLAQVS